MVVNLNVSNSFLIFRGAHGLGNKMILTVPNLQLDMTKSAKPVQEITQNVTTTFPKDYLDLKFFEDKSLLVENKNFQVGSMEIKIENIQLCILEDKQIINLITDDNRKKYREIMPPITLSYVINNQCLKNSLLDENWFSKGVITLDKIELTLSSYDILFFVNWKQFMDQGDYSKMMSDEKVLPVYQQLIKKSNGGCARVIQRLNTMDRAIEIGGLSLDFIDDVYATHLSF
jgi:hypothetical protein